MYVILTRLIVSLDSGSGSLSTENSELSRGSWGKVSVQGKRREPLVTDQNIISEETAKHKTTKTVIICNQIKIDKNLKHIYLIMSY